MEMELKHIISKIKEEGVNEAEKEAAEIIQKAQKESNAIIEGAEREKAVIINNGVKEVGKMRANAEKELKQSARDVLLALKTQITAIFDNIVKAEMDAALSPDAVKDMVVRLAEAMGKENKTDIEVLMSEKDKTALEKHIKAAISRDALKGIEINVSPKIEKGFRIGMKGSNLYYDFTDDAVTESFLAFLNPRIAEMLKSGI